MLLFQETAHNNKTDETECPSTFPIVVLTLLTMLFFTKRTAETTMKGDKPRIGVYIRASRY